MVFFRNDRILWWVIDKFTRGKHCEIFLRRKGSWLAVSLEHWDHVTDQFFLTTCRLLRNEALGIPSSISIKSEQIQQEGLLCQLPKSPGLLCYHYDDLNFLLNDQSPEIVRSVHQWAYKTKIAWISINSNRCYFSWSFTWKATFKFRYNFLRLNLSNYKKTCCFQNGYLCTDLAFVYPLLIQPFERS